MLSDFEDCSVEDWRLHVELGKLELGCRVVDEWFFYDESFERESSSRWCQRYLSVLCLVW